MASETIDPINCPLPTPLLHSSDPERHALHSNARQNARSAVCEPLIAYEATKYTHVGLIYENLNENVT